MKVTLTTNLGTADLRRFGLDSGVEGQAVDVDDKVADELLKKGWATQGAARAVPSPRSTVAARTEAEPAPDLDAMTKAEIIEYGTAKGVLDLDMNMTKDELIAAVEDATKS